MHQYDADNYDLWRRWEPADGGYISTYASGPPTEVNVSARGIVIALRGQIVDLSPDGCRWLAARLSEAAGIHEALKGVRARP